MGSNLSSPDILIAGGGPAGASLAILLGRLGFSVELYERSLFPREKPCGEGLMPAGVAVLERMGLAEAVGGETFFGIRYHAGGRMAEGRFPAKNGAPVIGRAQRRFVLDRVLFEAAASTPGVAAHTGARIEGPLCESGRVVGLRAGGLERRARLVVAADGAHSPLRRALGLDQPPRRKRFGARAHFRLASGKIQSPWVDVFAERGCELYVAMLPNRELLVAALADADALHGSIARTFHRWCQAQPKLAHRLEGAEQISDLLCDSSLGSAARCGVAPGIVLLGDAAGSLDPITGCGMTHAFITAELLAGFVQRGLLEDEARLWEFESARRRILRDDRLLTRAVLWLADHPRAAAGAVSLLRAAPGVLSHLVGAIGSSTRAGSPAASSSPVA